MNTKAIIIIFVVIAIAFIFAIKPATAPDQSDTKEDKEISIDNQLFLKSIKNSTLVIPDVEIPTPLIDGYADFEVSGMPVSGFVAVDEIFESKAVRLSDGRVREDGIAIIGVNNGGTGVFSYAMVFENRNGRPIQKSYAFIGDRIIVKSIEIENNAENDDAYKVILNYLDRDIGEAMNSTPTIPKKIVLFVENGIFNHSKTER